MLCFKHSLNNNKCVIGRVNKTMHVLACFSRIIRLHIRRTRCESLKSNFQPLIQKKIILSISRTSETLIVSMIVEGISAFIVCSICIGNSTVQPGTIQPVGSKLCWQRICNNEFSFGQQKCCIYADLITGIYMNAKSC